jgi:hypothetical protein
MTFLIQYWKPLLGSVLGIALVAFGFYVKGLRSDNQALTVKLERTEALLANYAQVLSTNQAALAAREKDLAAIQRERSKANQKLKETYESDPEPVLGLVLAFLTLFTGSYASRLPEVLPCAPPVVYLQTVPEPVIGGPTNADLVRYAIDLKYALRQANADKEALRLWAEGQLLPSN